MADTLSFFLSCPDDVCLEQSAAEQVVRRLRDQYARHMRIAEPATGRSLFGTANSTFNHGFINDFDVIVVVLWMRPPAAEFLTALEHLQSKTPTDLLIYLRTSAFNAEDMSVTEQQQLAEDVQRLDDFCVMLRSHPHVSPRIWREFTDADSFTDQLEFDLERHIEGHLFGDAEPAVCWDANPFVGLESFGPGQAMIFCGRDAAIQEALTELQRRASASVSLPSLLIVGASGTGKSSLARCGLAGRIGLLFPTAAQIELRPGDGSGSALIQRLGAELMRLFPDHGLRLNELMLRDPAAAVMQLERLRPNLVSTIHEPVFVLIVDQLEELFGPQPDADDLRQFATMLDLLVRRGLCWCIATLRSDCLGRLSDVKSFSHFTENGGVYVLPQPTPSEIRSMIRRPARLAGVQYEQPTESGETLADRILRDVPRGSSGLPLLQFTLRKLYDDRSASGSLTYRAYTSLGGLLGCVAAHAESVFSELAVHEQGVFAVVFRELVRVSTDDRLPARQRCRLSVFDGNTAAMGLVQALISARLLVRDDEHGVATVELVHESLLQTWPRLRDWLNVEGELLRKRLRLLEAYERWSHSHRTPDLLLPRGTALDEANEVLSAGLLSAEHDRSSLVRRFIRQSQRAVQRIQRQRRRAADLLADSQLKSLELSIDSVSDSLESLEQLAAKELDADRLPNTLQYLHEAELLATTRRGELLRQIEERLTVPERNNRADSGFAARLQALRQRVSDSLFLDPEYWRHREANILREFPELVWRRNLKTKIKRAILSPNNDYLLLLTAFRTDETVVVWDLKKNQPTECCVKLQFTQGTPVLTWAADGRSFILINQNASSDPVIADTQICVWDAISGDLITGPIRHRGLVLDAACSADDGHLVVVNRYDGTAIELQTLLERSATIVEPSGFIAVCKSLFRTNAPTATVTRYEMPSLKIIRQKVIGGWIRSCSMVDGWLACQPIQTVREPDAEAAEGTVVLINFHLEAELRYADALTAGSIGLSPDGRYLAVAGRETGIQLLERVHGRLRWLANAGTSPPDAVIQVRPRVAEPGVTPDIDIVVGETPFTTDGKVASTRQTIVSYTYSAQSRKISTTFSVAAEAQLTALALHRNGTGFGLLAAGLANGSARIWQRSTGKSLTPFLDLAHECVLVEFLDRSDFSFGTPFPFLTVTNGGEITLWNISANALREPLLLSDVSRQRPVAAPSNLPKLSVWQSPDEQKLVYHMPDRWTHSVMVVPRGQVQHRPENIVIIGFAAEAVFWTPDSRYAVIVSGLTSRRTGPMNVLYSNAIVSSQMKFEIPQQSYLAVVDLHSLKLVGRPLRFDGPLVDVRMHSVQNVCFVGFLSATSGKGQLWRLNPADLTFDSFTEQMPEFCCFSVSADFTTAVISDRSGQPMVFSSGQPVRKLPKPVNEISGYIGVQILDSGLAVLMEPADPTADVVHVSLMSGDFCAIRMHAPPRSRRQLVTIPGRDEFLVNAGNAELLIIDGCTGDIRKSLFLDSPVVTATFTLDGRILAAYSFGGMISLFDTTTWHKIIPPIQWPILSIGLDSGIMALRQFEFSTAGNLLLSQFAPLVMRLTSLPESKSTNDIVRLLSCRNLMQESFDLDIATTVTSCSRVVFDGDSFDALAWILPMADRDTAQAIIILQKLNLEDITISWVARRLAILQLQIAQNANDIGAWRKALDFLTSAKVPLQSLDRSYVALLLKHLCFASMVQAQITLRNWQRIRPAVAESSILSIQDRLSDSNLLSAAGRHEEAWSHYSHLFQSLLFRMAVAAIPGGGAFVLRGAFCGLQNGRSFKELLPHFDALQCDKNPSVVVLRRYFCFLNGLTTTADVDLSILDISIDPRIPLFHRFIDELERQFASEAGLQLARDMVHASSNDFRLAASLGAPSPLPVLRAHCRLFEADALLRLKRRDEAKEAVLAAMQDWDAYCQQLTNLGLDPRALWVERVGYELLMSRIGTQLSQDSEAP